MHEKILIVEDEVSLQETLAYSLKNQGYDVLVAGDGQAGVKAAKDNQPALIVLDIMLPILDGFEVCRIIRQEMNVPILMLTARDDQIDRVIGLEMGADDYLSKPFNMRELIARVKALLRRVRFDREDTTNSTGKKDVLVFENLSVDTMRREVTLNGKPLSLKPKEYDLLLYLSRHRRQVLSRDMLLESVWDWSFSGGSRTVDVHIRWLREKIEEDPTDPKRIVTVRGVGYRFEG